MEKERKKTMRIKFTLCRLHSCSIHMEVDSKFLKIEDSKLCFKSEFSPINRASTFFVSRVGKRASRAEKEQKKFRECKVLRVQKIFSCNFLFSVWVLPPSAVNQPVARNHQLSVRYIFNKQIFHIQIFVLLCLNFCNKLYSIIN